jgi:hypothetical protein
VRAECPEHGQEKLREIGGTTGVDERGPLLLYRCEVGYGSDDPRPPCGYHIAISEAEDRA